MSREILEGGYLTAGVYSSCVSEWIYVNDFGEYIKLQGCVYLEDYLPFPFNHFPLQNQDEFMNLQIPKHLDTTLKNRTTWCPFSSTFNETNDIIMYSPQPNVYETNHKSWAFCSSFATVKEDIKEVFTSIATKYQSKPKEYSSYFDWLPKVTVMIFVGFILGIGILVKRKRSAPDEESSATGSKAECNLSVENIRRKKPKKGRKVRFDLSNISPSILQEEKSLPSIESLDLNNRDEEEYSEYSISEDSS